jgi:CRP/FNR family transcriptional regulator, cyclic AMP receptor protein
MAIDPSMLAEGGFFASLDPGEREALAAHLDHVTVGQGEVLFEFGEPGDFLYIVRTGAVELFVKDTTGQKIVLAMAQPGDLFGELSLLDDGPRTATATAVVDSELIALDRDDLLLLVRSRPEVALNMLSGLSRMARKADELLRRRVARNVNAEMEERITFLQRVSDWIAAFSGSLTFLALNAIWFFSWISINTFDLSVPAFDPFPFGLLTMIVSLEAIFLSVFVLISQNRQAQKDRVRSDIEYAVNVKAELEVASLHEKIDRIHEVMVSRSVRLERMLAERTRSSA